MTITCPQLGHQGRLGNQLFQLAATLGIAHTQGVPACLPDDWTYREWFSLPPFLYGTCGGTPADHYAPHIDERARPYLQDYGLFRDRMPELRTWLAPSSLALEIMAEHRREFDTLPRPILSVHVRRGDAVAEQDPRTPHKEQFHPCLPLSYYQRAIDLLKGQAASIAVFGDEPEWNEANLGDRVDYIHYGIPNAVEHETGPGRKHFGSPLLDWIDLQLMAECTAGHCLANSTFGMWSALLADDNQAIVPDPIFGPALRYIDTSLLGPSTWTKLRY